jgi:hypothetical protein
MKRNTSVLQFVCLFAATVAQAQSRPSEAKQILPLLQASALRKSDPLVLGRSDPGQEQDWES